ncbi:MAG: serine/threonine-protein kinase [Phycisphaerae bacterium]|jgi:non-specific serine/threonine protein kinase/serine/threonine-protein kinase
MNAGSAKPHGPHPAVGSADPTSSAAGDASTIRRGPQESPAARSETEGGATGQSVGPLPAQIGRYKVRRIIASGGMGTVYEATQEKPRRAVAVKVMKHGIASPSAMRRFEYEAQLLARLHHPGIAQIYEADTFDDGSGCVPYFAMEYILGARPITKYADEKKLGTRQRLELFVRVCDAVQHGHQKGIIHRDLKPGNILVDAQGEPKIIDFGVARGTDSDLAVTTLQTDVGQLVGTLQYMSPEQCAADPHDIDVRSDVYALGVVLYELLSGKLPYDVRNKPAYECTRVIREETPDRLSTVDRTLRGDVETIVAKALEKDRDRRYQCAVELAQDIRRYLAGQAIVARTPSMAYQLRLFARRHRALLTGAAVVAGVLVVGAGVSTWLAVWAMRAERQVSALLDQTEKARQQAVHKAAVAQRANDFVSEILASVAPTQAGLRTARDVLDDAAKRVDREFAQEPLAKALIHLTLANTYWELGVYEVALHHADQAVRLRRAELGEGHRDTLTAMNTLAVLYRYVKRYDEARELQAETLDLREKHLGPEDPDTLGSMNNLAVVLRSLGRLDEGEWLHRKALETRRRVLGPEHVDTLSSMTNLAALLSDKGELNEAVALTREALDIRRRALDAGHPDTLQSMNNLAKLLVERGEWDEAERLYREALPLARRTFGDRHPRVATLQRNLAEVLARQGNDAAAIPYFEEARRLRQDARPPDDETVVDIMADLGACWTRLKQYETAERILLEAWERLERPEVQSGPQTRADVVRALVELYDAWGRADQAAEWRPRLPAAEVPATRPSDDE